MLFLIVTNHIKFHCYENYLLNNNVAVQIAIIRRQWWGLIIFGL